MAPASSDDGHAIFGTKLTEFCRQIPSAHRELKEIVARNQEDIQKRWETKVKQKNKARKVLKTVWSDMPKEHYVVRTWARTTRILRQTRLRDGTYTYGHI
ncbi:hypothetical protein BR93DRAFT_972307 [Coniochaeta sp. PMI_546]|nr:hypothetical protein BR93DRAFT_972307 [Coniochaeta sp. PMI_546]